jgi:hypothetical protein
LLCGRRLATRWPWQCTKSGARGSRSSRRAVRMMTRQARCGARRRGCTSAPPSQPRGPACPMACRAGGLWGRVIVGRLLGCGSVWGLRLAARYIKAASRPLRGFVCLNAATPRDAVLMFLGHDPSIAGAVKTQLVLPCCCGASGGRARPRPLGLGPGPEHAGVLRPRTCRGLLPRGQWGRGRKGGGRGRLAGAPNRGLVAEWREGAAVCLGPCTGVGRVVGLCMHTYTPRHTTAHTYMHTCKNTHAGTGAGRVRGRLKDFRWLPMLPLVEHAEGQEAGPPSYVEYVLIGYGKDAKTPKPDAVPLPCHARGSAPLLSTSPLACSCHGA